MTPPTAPATGRMAILDPFSGVAGDMMLGALIDLGLDAAFIEALPRVLGLEGIGVRVARTSRAGIGAVKVDFDIPPQPHGRHLRQLIEIVERAPLSPAVKARSCEAFRLIATVEAAIHGTTVERVHLHEVGAVDAILDVVGNVWGAEQLGIADVRCGTIALGDGTVTTAHGEMPVPAPATAALLTGWPVANGPAGTGELTTPTGAALVRVLASGPPPAQYVAHRIGYGAGTRDLGTRPNLLRITLADAAAAAPDRERVVLLTADVDDMSPEHIAVAADRLRDAGALDVTLTPLAMKKGRPGFRLDALVLPSDGERMEELILMKTSSIGVRRSEIFRRTLTRTTREVSVLGHLVRIKVSALPDGSARIKAEADDVRRVTLATDATWEQIVALVDAEARRPGGGV